MSRRATPDLAQLIGDLAAAQLVSSGRGKRIGPLAADVWEQLVRELLANDPRFVESSGGFVELAEVRASREQVMVGG